MLSFTSLSIATAITTLFLGTNAGPLLAERWAPELPTCTNTTDFVYAGCFIDPSSPSALLFRTDLNSQNMTVEICVDFCKGNGYKYAGLEYYGECFCGASVGGPQTSESNCSFPCTGDNTESCGGNDILSVYQDTTFPTVDSTTISDYTPMGCYSDLGPNGRTLAWKQDQILDADLTIEACLQACKEGGYAFAGVEYSQECYCGVVLGNGTAKVDESNCQMTCNGNTTELCGGAANLYLYVAEDLLSTDPCNGNPGGPVSSSTSSSSPSTSASTSAPVSSSTGTTITSTLSPSISSYSSSLSSETSSSSAASTPYYSPPPYTPPPYTPPPYTPPPYTPPPYTPPPYSSAPVSSSIYSSVITSSSSSPASSAPASSSSSVSSAAPSSSSTSISPPSSYSIPSSSASSSYSSASASSSSSPISTAPSSSASSSSPASSSSSVSAAPSSSSTPVSPSYSSSPPTTYSAPASSSSISHPSSTPPLSSSSIPSNPPSSSPSSTAGPTSPTLSSSTISSTISSLSSPPTISQSSTTTYFSSSVSSTAPTSSTTTILPSTSISSTQPSTTASPTTPKTIATICTTTIVTTPTPTCEYKVGNWCSNPLPPFTDQNSCLTAANTCLVQLTSCLLSAGFPGSLQCLQFSSWCQEIESYCGSYCPGSSCSNTGCRSRHPPAGYTPPVISVRTSIYTCPTTIQTSTSKPTSTSSIAPLPTCNNICVQPNNPSQGYSSFSPVGSIPIPCYTCNNLQPEYNSGYPFKLYTARNSEDSPSYQRPDCGQGCQDACDAQYESCVGTYAQSCGYGGGGGGDTYASALVKCVQQKADCYIVNEGVGGEGRCGSYGVGY
ncbi:hypothetical protein BELL_0253g00090 [Botrytis elliptica]|uniref:WSC domain-containing protein n=1 Tax=Botrytis elliptica TaxID=278938 RepID=A0A4Z1JMZ3_9HELO|nr:hypothetical protein EAE99_004233 [Botrytis elliptica]TGO74836.1 hypothetical protein BELL_0253g00090 [Botrytis elliptica]